MTRRYFSGTTPAELAERMSDQRERYDDRDPDEAYDRHVQEQLDNAPKPITDDELTELFAALVRVVCGAREVS